MFKLFNINLQLFANANTQTTGSANLSPEMKTYYSDYLIDMAAPKLVHNQFGQKQPIPKNGGKTVEFRKFNALPKLHNVPLTEGITPNGQTMSVSKVEATVKQYGGYVTLSDMYLLTAIDNNLIHATKLLGNQAGATIDTVIREVLNGGTNVVYAGGNASRSALVAAKASDGSKLHVVDVKKAVRALKVQNTPKIGDSYVGIIHPDVTFDLTNDPEWKYPHQYVDTDEIYTGEIGKIAGVRFAETTEAKVMAGNKPLTLNGSPVVVAEDGDALGTTIVIEANPYIDSTVFKVNATITIRGISHLITAINGNVITIDSAAGIMKGDIVTIEGNATSVYSTLILGEDAYGVTEIEGGGLEFITKPLGAGDDPLNQRATAGWKASLCAERLVEPYMVRIESLSTFDGDLN